MTPTLPQSRAVPLTGALNARDLGGLPVAGGQVASGRVLRADALTGLTDQDRALLADRELGTVIDFRAPSEVELFGADLLPDGATLESLPIPDVSADGAAALGPLIMAGDVDGVAALLGDGRAAQIMDDGYAALVRRPAARTAFAAALAALADTDTALLYHCQAGKDRTGWMTALVLSVLGADTAVITEDYLASNTFLAARNEALYTRLADGGIDPELLRPLTEQRAEYLARSFSVAVDDYGSMREYLRRGLGVDDARAARLRDRLLA